MSDTQPKYCNCAKRNVCNNLEKAVIKAQQSSTHIEDKHADYASTFSEDQQSGIWIKNPEFEMHYRPGCGTVITRISTKFPSVDNIRNIKETSGKFMTVKVSNSDSQLRRYNRVCQIELPCASKIVGTDSAENTLGKVIIPTKKDHLSCAEDSYGALFLSNSSLIKNEDLHIEEAKIKDATKYKELVNIEGTVFQAATKKEYLVNKEVAKLESATKNKETEAPLESKETPAPVFSKKSSLKSVTKKSSIKSLEGSQTEDKEKRRQSFLRLVFDDQILSPRKESSMNTVVSITDTLRDESYILHKSVSSKTDSYLNVIAAKQGSLDLSVASDDQSRQVKFEVEGENEKETDLLNNSSGNSNDASTYWDFSTNEEENDDEEGSDSEKSSHVVLIDRMVSAIKELLVTPDSSVPQKDNSLNSTDTGLSSQIMSSELSVSSGTGPTKTTMSFDYEVRIAFTTEPKQSNLQFFAECSFETDSSAANDQTIEDKSKSTVTIDDTKHVADSIDQTIENRSKSIATIDDKLAKTKSISIYSQNQRNIGDQVPEVDGATTESFPQKSTTTHSFVKLPNSYSTNTTAENVGHGMSLLEIKDNLLESAAGSTKTLTQKPFGNSVGSSKTVTRLDSFIFDNDAHYSTQRKKSQLYGHIVPITNDIMFRESWDNFENPSKENEEDIPKASENVEPKQSMIARHTNQILRISQMSQTVTKKKFRLFKSKFKNLFSAFKRKASSSAGLENVNLPSTSTVGRKSIDLNYNVVPHSAIF